MRPLDRCALERRIVETLASLGLRSRQFCRDRYVDTVRANRRSQRQRGAISSVGERFRHTVGVTGSIPVSPTNEYPRNNGLQRKRFPAPEPLFICRSFVA
jgi:hypothetical protein